MRVSRYSVRLLVLSGAIVLACREDEAIRPSLSLVPSNVQAVEVTEAKLAIQKIQLIGATTNIPSFTSLESFGISVNLGGMITRLQSFSVPAGSYATVKVQIGKLDGDPMLGRSILIRGNVIQNGVANPFAFTSALSTMLFRQFDPSLDVPPHSEELVQVVGLATDRSKWFVDTQGNVLDPRDPANQTQIENNLKKSLVPYVGQLLRGFAIAPTSDATVVAFAVDPNGSQVDALSDGSGQVTGATFVAPQGQTLTVLRGQDGLPARAVGGGQIFLFANWTASSVDIAVIAADGRIQVLRNVNANSALIATLRGPSGSISARLAAVGPAPLGTFGLPSSPTEKLELAAGLLGLVACIMPGVDFVCAAVASVGVLAAIAPVSPPEIQASSTGLGLYASQLVSLVPTALQCEEDVIGAVGSEKEKVLSILPDCGQAAVTLGKDVISDVARAISNHNAVITQAQNRLSGPKKGSCQPSSSMSALVQGTNVVAYVPKGAWEVSVSGVSAVNVEGTSITNTLIPTPNAVNSCASNPLTGITVCTANNTDVYRISGASLVSTLTSGGSGFIGFSGGFCTNCGIVIDAVNDQAVIGLSIGGTPGFQFLKSVSTAPSFEPPFASASGSISEDALIDPSSNRLLSAAENNKFEIIDVTTTTSPSFFVNGPIPAGGELDATAEDCDTQIGLAPAEFSGPSSVFIADLSTPPAVFTTGTPGTWSAPSQVQSLSESFLSAGASGLAVAQGTHTGIVSGEFGGAAVTAIALPTTSGGGGTPAITDWVTCAIPSLFNGLDPHTLTAYQSPNGGHAIAVLANAGASTLAVVDLTNMLNPTIVPRTVGGHGCGAGTLPGTVVSLLSVP